MYRGGRAKNGRWDEEQPLSGPTQDCGPHEYDICNVMRDRQLTCSSEPQTGLSIIVEVVPEARKGKESQH